MQRRVFNAEHELFREQFKKFCAREVTPNVEQVGRAAHRRP